MTQIRQYKAGKFYRDEFRGDLSWNGYEHNVLLRGAGTNGEGDLQFADVAMATGADDIKDARGMAIADFDNDGDYDIVINNNPGDCGREAVPPALLRNDIGQKRNWLAVHLRGSSSNRDAVGAQVTVRCTTPAGKSVQLLRQVTAGGGYASQNSDRLYFGLGDVSHVEWLSVVWPSGQVQSYRDIAANQFVDIEEGNEAAHLSGGATPWQLTQ